MEFKLNNEQDFALTTLLTWLQSPVENEAMILEGYAGTGKTTLIREIVKAIERVVLCAPTNKAVGVLSKHDTGKACMTIQSLLGLQMKAKNDRKVLTEDKDKVKIGSYKILIIDETSMIDSALFKFIRKAMKKYGLKVLFAGDPEQLNPVGEDISPVFGSYPTVRLNTVMRHDNQILTLATHIRTTPYRKILIESDFNKSGGVYVFDEQNFMEGILKYASKGFFQDNVAKVIAWRNSTVLKYNDMVREHLLGKEAFKSKYVVGERIIFTEPFGMAITTDMEARILSVQRDTYKVFADNYKRFVGEMNILVLEVSLDNGEIVSSVKIIDESSKEFFDDYLDTLAGEAYENHHLWRVFWNFKEKFASIRHAYAITTHRSQGSTYRDVFIDVNDIRRNKNLIEAKRCLYVAATRPTTKLICLED